MSTDKIEKEVHRTRATLVAMAVLLADVLGIIVIVQHVFTGGT